MQQRGYKSLTLKESLLERVEQIVDINPHGRFGSASAFVANAIEEALKEIEKL